MNPSSSPRRVVYSIKQVSGLTGVSAAALRAWESRYAVVAPSRTASGYRQYDDAQVSLLREMAALVAAGVPASRAAAVLHSQPLPEHAAPVEGDGGLIAAAERLDPAALAGAISGGGPTRDFEAFADAWLPARLEEMGEAWEQDRLGVAEEHFASAGLMRAIGTVMDAADGADVEGRVLIGLPAGNRHEIMLFAFVACLRRLGADVAYLGADVPAAEWERAARDHRARAAVVGVTLGHEPAAAQEVLDRLRDVVPPVSLWVGGSRRGEVTGAMELPDAPSEAAGLLHRALLAGI